MAHRIALWAAYASVLFPMVSCSGSDHATLFTPSGSGGSGGAEGSTVTTGTSSAGTSAGGTSDTAGAGGTVNNTIDGGGGTTVGSGGSLGGSGGGTVLDGGTGVCVANTDCAANQYCRKIGCGSLTLGKCALRPTTCDPTESVVCGCDGFTYFNDCLAAESGQNLRTHDPCLDTAVRCMSGSDPACGMAKNAYCGFLFTDQTFCASTTLRGKCWILPDTCPQTLDHYDACTGGDKCMHACDAVKTEKPVFRNTVCD